MRSRYLLDDQVADIYVADGEALVLRQESLYRLGALALEILQACRQPRTVAELSQILVAAFGAPPQGEATEAVEAVVDELLACAILQEVL